MSELVRVLHIDDAAADRELVCDVLERAHGGFEVVQAASREELEARLAEDVFDAVLSDINVLGFEGLDLIDQVREKAPDVPLIIVTGTGSETIAVEAMKQGAADYVIKTPTHIRRRPLTIQAALEKARLHAERKQAQQALRESEEKYRSLIEHSSDAIYLLYENRFEIINPRFTELFGVTSEEARAPDFDYLSLVAPKSRPLIEERRGKQTLGQELDPRYEFTAQDKEENEIEVEASVSYISYQNGVATQGVLRDITERKRAEEEKTQLEERYHQAQKAESIGRLAGGVSHDLNNLLSPILGYSEMLLDDLAPDDARRESVNEILRAGFRARDLVRQLMAFSGKQTLEYEPVDMNKAVTGFEKLLRRTIREDVEIEIIPSPDIRTVMADIGEIEQVIMNLAVNAADAMPEGGHLTIETAPANLDEDYAAKHWGVKPGAYVMLAVSDTGPGMDDETRKHLFEPFFSTKGEQGTGLGLATVYGIVKQHGGNVWVYSEPGKGTTFKVYLPVSEEARAEEKASKKTAAGLKGSETILLAEDNEQVRRLAQHILRRQGYTVLVAEDGPEALTILASHDDPVHLLLTDVVMPEMNGRELFARATESHPGLKVLYMSGYTASVIAHRGVLEEGTAFIQKPFNVQALAAKVREVLEQE